MKFKGSATGAALIIAGTAVGAGMLGIPLIAGGLGFVLASLLLIVCWGVMMIAAFLLLHVNMAYPEQSNLGTMARKTIGIFGTVLTWISYLLVLYAFISAYMTGGASLLGRTLSQYLYIETSPIFDTLIFTCALGIFVYFGTRSVDYVNRILLTIKLGAFFLMVVLLMPRISLASLTPVPAEPSSLLIAVPVIISAYAFQMVIPSLRDYLQSNINKIKRAIWIGGTIPLIIYLFWVAIIFGLLPDLTSEDDLATMVSMLENKVKLPLLKVLINCFTDIAVTTSFLGISMSLFHFIRDGCHLNKNRIGEKPLAILMTFLPPFCFAWFFPKGFLLALNYAGVFSVVLLLIIPVWMGLWIRHKKVKSAFPFNLHWTGVVLILGLSVVALGVQLFHH